MPETAVTETRTFEVRCRREITERCLGSAQRDNFDEITSISSAEAAFRADGWQLHGDGTASCPECLAVWEGTTDVEAEPEPEEDPDEHLEDAIVVDPAEGNVR